MKITFRQLPKQIQTEFKIQWPELLSTGCTHKKDSKLMSKLLGINVKYIDHNGGFIGDEIEFISDHDYTLFLLKFSDES